MKWGFLCLFLASTVNATSYYISSTGNDTHDGLTVATAWLTLGHAMLPGSIACGDTINIVADGNYVVGDANLPYFANCGKTTTIQSSALAQFKPVGYRTNPVTDANIYGKLKFVFQGINSPIDRQISWPCSVSAVSGSTMTLGSCYAQVATMTNGSQVSIAIDNQGSLSAYSVPAGLTILQDYYVVNCSAGCGTNGSTLQLAATPGGTPISMTCDPAAGCVLGALQFGYLIQVSVASSSFTALDDLTAFGNGTPIVISMAGTQNDIYTNPSTAYPSPLQINTIYYMSNVTGRQFQLSLSSGGPIIPITDIGRGPMRFSSARAPHDWAFRGLEMVEAPASVIYNLISFGLGDEAGTTVGLSNHMEVDRCYLHDRPSDETGPGRGVADNGMYISIHDSYIGYMRSLGEAQAIGGWSSPGPTWISNNFLEANGENTLYGGQVNASGATDSFKTFTGNYYYKAPMMKVTTCDGGCTGAPSGPCWYDDTDPNHVGGEWYVGVVGGNTYTWQCPSTGVWGSSTSATATTIQYAGFVKTMAEHKNGQYFLYTGNVFSYNWGSAQSGQIFNINQEAGSGPGMANDHIVIQNNFGKHFWVLDVDGSQCDGLLSIKCHHYPSDHVMTNNIYVQDPLACGVSSSPSITCGWHPEGLGFGGYMSPAMVWMHNTLYTPDGMASAGLNLQNANLTPNSTAQFLVSPYFTFKNNISPKDIVSDEDGSCSSPIALVLSSSTFTNNVIPNGGTAGGCSYGSSGATNSFANYALYSGMDSTGFTSTSTYNFQLLATSSFSAANASATLLSDDGTDMGADVQLVAMATSGAVNGTPPWDVMAGLQVVPGSTKAVFRYNAPTVATCTATIYNSIVRIPNNVVATVADSSNTSVSDSTRRELLLQGLSPSTAYSYGLACGNNELMVGSFRTKASGSGTYNFTKSFSGSEALTYCTNAGMSAGCTTLGASATQTIPVSTNSVIYAQPSGGEISMLVTP